MALPSTEEQLGHLRLAVSSLTQVVKALASESPHLPDDYRQILLTGAKAAEDAVNAAAGLPPNP